MSTTLRDAFSVTRFSFWTGVMLSTLVGSVLYVVTTRSIESDVHERFVRHAKYAQAVINMRIKSYTDLLRGAASVLQSGDTLTHRQFHDYVQGLHLARNYPAVDTLNFATWVREDQRPQFEAEFTRELQAFLGPDARPVITPSGIRLAYLVVTYIEPDAKNTRLYGLDLMSNPYFRTQLAQSRDDGMLRASGRPIAALSTSNDNHLGMRVPVYRHGPLLTSVEQRRAAYLGSLGIAFSLPKLLNGVMDEMPIPGVRMTLFDVGPREVIGHDTSTWPKVLFDSRGTVANPTPPLDSGDDVFTATLPLDFNGRPWQTTYSVQKARLRTDFDIYYPKLMMAFGFLGSVLLYALLHILTSSRRAALELAQEMTSELRESQTKLQLSHQKLRRLADHAYQIKELERKRIAREIHDDLGQSLLALRIEAELLAGRTKGTHNHLNKRARSTLLQIDTTIKSVRQIINDLRPTVLDLGLSAAVEWQVDQFQKRTGIQCEIQDDHGEIALADHCATAFFRILQESLTNIVRHANATHVKVELRLNGGWLSLTVRDNGCGLPPGGRNKYGSFGLVGIEERVVILGGTCAVFSEPGGGTTVMVSAPVIGGPESVLTQQQEHGAGSAVI
ncbi:Histidine kinase-, DNA gyrase B-, and HSP90-like ATPase [Massilia sp. PDC64]|nr:CHASE domain-containing protein [Massilia sp. PDC64]SDC76409.1 Histidine kinase-, DNA gyrase B-, and HSP90-like ATPase [Massilia sp. PDC64]